MTPDIIDGKYRVIREVGSGGMAHVYRAINMSSRKVVAVKMLKEEYLDDQEFLRRFEREAKASLALSHENIVRAYGVGDDNGVPYIVLEYVEGKTLKDLIRESPGGHLSVQQSIGICSQILDALSYAHTHGIIHRDVKPQNIMFATLNGLRVLWLIDFGISVRLHETKTATQGQYAASGTPYYMAPEQWEEEKQDERTDQYALAAIAYHFLAGRPPFDAKNHFAIGHKALSNPVPVIEWLSPEMNEVLRRGLAKRKEDRFPTCSEFIEALKTSASPQVGHQAQPRLELFEEPPVNPNSSFNSGPNFQTDTLSQTDFISVSVSSENGRSSVSTHFSSKSKPNRPKKWKDMSQKEKEQATGCAVGCLVAIFLFFLICFLGSSAP